MVVLAIISLFLPYLFLIGRSAAIKQNISWIIFFLTLISYSIVYLWRALIIEINQIEISTANIKIKNIITRRQKIIENNLKQYRINVVTGKMLLLDNTGKTVIKLNERYYSNIQEMISYLNLEKAN